MTKLTFDEALEALGDERRIKAEDVLASALKRKVWIAEWHIPGCLPESSTICTSKADAIQQARSYADGTEARGMATALRKHGFFQHKTEMYGYVNTTITQQWLSDCF